MIDIAERKLVELQRNIFTIKVITAVSRFFVEENKYQEIKERWSYLEEMYASLDNYLTLYNTTSNIEYKNYYENNFQTCADVIEEQKALLYPLYSLNSLVFLENVKTNIRDGFIKEVDKIISQFVKKEDVAEYICYHGSKDLNDILDFALTYTISPNLTRLFTQVKEQRVITYKYNEWINVSAKLNTALLEIKSKGNQDLFVDEYIYKLSAYRFLLTIFAYDI